MLVESAVKRHIILIPYVCYTPAWAASKPENYWRQPPKDPRLFGDFMERISARYRGRVRSWELWNEPNITPFWQGTVNQYAELVKAGAAGRWRSGPRGRHR